MKESTRKAREQLKHDEALATLLGITLEEVQAQREKEERDDKTREVQAVHLFLEHPDAFVEKTCTECHLKFMTTYKFVSNCSSACRIKSLERVGINYNPMHTAENRWARSQIPAEYSIPPAALKILLQIAADQEKTQDLSHNMVDPIDPIDQMQKDFEPVEEFLNISQSNNVPQESPDELPPVLEEWEVDYSS